MTIRFYEVGGCVRDELLGIPTKDIDFTAVVDGIDTVPEAYDHLLDTLKTMNYQVFLETPEYGTIRARFPDGHPLLGRTTADFVLARKDGPSSDGRRPDYVTVGTLEDDLARRDFTVNALARELLSDCYGPIIDLHHGQWDLAIRCIRFVGDPMERLQEDGLRALRAIRFMITKDFTMHPETLAAVTSFETAELLSGTSAERRRDELEKCFSYDTIRTMEFLSQYLPPGTVKAIFTGNVRLAATMKVDQVRRAGQ